MTPQPAPTERECLRRLREQAARDLRAIVTKREQEQSEAERLKLERELAEQADG